MYFMRVMKCSSSLLTHTNMLFNAPLSLYSINENNSIAEGTDYDYVLSGIAKLGALHEFFCLHWTWETFFSVLVLLGDKHFWEFWLFNLKISQLLFHGHIFFLSTLEIWTHMPMSLRATALGRMVTFFTFEHQDLYLVDVFGRPLCLEAWGFWSLGWFEAREFM